MPPIPRSLHVKDRPRAIWIHHRPLLPVMVTRRLKDADMPGWRWWVIRRTPTVLIDYLFEVLIACVAVITSIAYFTGWTSEASVIRVLPDWLAALYGITISIAAATVILGLVTCRYGTTLAYGLRVLAIGCLVYAASAASFAGSRALAPIVMSASWALLAAWRAFVLRSTYFWLLAETRQQSNGGTEGKG